MEPHNLAQDDLQPKEQQNALVIQGIELYKKVQDELGDVATSEEVRLATTDKFLAWYHQEVKGPFSDEELYTVMNTVIAVVTMNRVEE